MRLGSVLFALVTLGVMAACGSGSPTAQTASSLDVDLPGIDTSQFTPRERHEFSRFVRELPAPCPKVAVPVATCILEHRACDTCLPAAETIAKAVREGMSSGQIEDLYRSRYDVATAKTIPVAGSPSRGPEDAPVTIVEFADFECPFCQKIAPLLDELWAARKDKVRFVFKYMPLPMHPEGEIAARAAIAAGNQGKFWEMHKILFAAGTRLQQVDLEGYATSLGLDVDKLRADMKAPATTARIAADHKLADDLSVHGTPTIYVDGRIYNANVDLGEWLDQEIAARK
jgi:protein-disulfide isomerase